MPRASTQREENVPAARTSVSHPRRLASARTARSGLAASPASRRPSPTGAPPVLFLTCEHGGNLVPADLASLFRGRARLIDSHRAWDPGALELAGHLAAALQAPLRFALVTRLIVDLNRSLDNPSLLSELTSGLTPREQRRLIARHYLPYRRDVEATISRLSRVAPVVHVGVHTFTPILRGRRRDVDIGLLFDPARGFERRVVTAWERRLRSALPSHARVRRNRPYRGTDDGLTTHLRARLADARYAGIELEVSQRYPRRGGTPWAALQTVIAETLTETLGSFAESAAR